MVLFVIMTILNTCLVYTLVASSVLNASALCPHECVCDFEESRKRVTCDRGGMTDIPTTAIDPDIQVLVISAPASNRNTLTLGRIFQGFPTLEEVRITHSTVPAIGDSSFWPGKRLVELDLSYNNITLLKERDFYGLSKLEVLNLSDNNIAATPSAPFHYLSSLRFLSLARNKLKTLVPRFFYLLPKLESLDLSGNPIQEIDPENLKDLKPLRRLDLSRCHLKRLHSLIYQQLPNLEELDLRHNEFQHFAPEEFRHLRNIRVLRLDGNHLINIVEKTFDGHRLDHLGLSHNRLVALATCTFCNTTVRSLDISHNRIETITSDVLAPIAHTLTVLNVGHNRLGSQRVGVLIRPLSRLQSLSLVDTALNEVLPEMFGNNPHLRHLNLSRNSISNISVDILQPLRVLEELDLSSNLFRGLYPALLDQFNNMTTLDVLHLHGNPWMCELCFVEGMLLWMRHNRVYREACENPGIDDQCLRCDGPRLLKGRDLVTLDTNHVPPCYKPVSESRVQVGTSQVGLAVALTIIIIIVLIIIVVIILYRRHAAVYYTREDERHEDALYGHLDVNGGGYGDQKKPQVYITTLDRIDEITEDRLPPRNSFG